MKIVPATIFLFLIAISSFAQKNSSLPIYQKLQVTLLPGSNDTVLTGTYPVYENREINNGRRINLNIVVIPALHPDASNIPVFYIEGGPGVSAASSGNVYFFADSSSGYRRYHDIVLVDIRGTGKSNPLNCISLQAKQTLQDQFDDMYPPEAVKECYDELSKRADLTQYTTVNVVKDLEDVRKFLVYSKISIFGLSYGTRVCLVYMKMFPRSIESCVLWSPIPAYGRIPVYFARFAQNSLDKLFVECREDAACHTAYPSLEVEFNVLMQKGKAAPFIVQRTDSNGRISSLEISWNSFETILRRSMYAPAGLRALPFIIHQCYLGNFKPFLSLSPQGSDTSYFIAEGYYLCITCAEDVPFIHDDEIDSMTQQTFMGTYRIDQQRSACKNWARGKIPDDFFDPVNSKIPTLIFSGGMDPVTPPSQAKEIASHLPNSQLMIIPEMSHVFDGLDHPECFDQIALDFIDHPSRALNTDCIAGMLPPEFRVK